MTEADVIQPSASIASPGLGIRYIGEWAYAFSGTISSSSEEIMLDFTSGSGVIIGKLTCAGSIPNNGGGVANGDISAFTLSFNGIEITRMKTETTQEDSPTYSTYPILIPPFTMVELKVLSTGTAGATSGMIVGRVYGAE